MAYSTIDKPSSYFDTKLYTGTGSTQSISGINFSPDWVWIKGRSGATDNGLYDAVRGVQKDLVSNATSAETTQTTGLTAFGSDGFTVGALAKLNTSTATYVAWNWLGANTTVSNNSGTITSTVSANTTSGFSIVTYTGTGANASIGHGLGAVPKFIIVKCRSNTMNWPTYNANATNGVSGISFLDVTDAEANYGTSYWQQTPTSTLFYVGNNTNTNNSSYTYVAYCFAEVKGFSKFGKYIGNGSTNGAFVYTGFKPAFVMVKRTDASGYDWAMMDNKRDTYNEIYKTLWSNLNNAEYTTTGSSGMATDLLSNGFKIRGTNGENNASGGTYIYMAFAENPFTSSKGIPCTAR